MNLKRLMALAGGSLLFVIANASIGYSQGASPVPGAGVPQAAPTPWSATVPPPPGSKLPLGIVNGGSKEVDVFIGSGLKCKLPSKYQCILEVPPGRYSIRFVRAGGGIFNDSFELPQTIAGQKYYGGAYVIREDRIEFGAPNAHPHSAASPVPPHP
jgi:hypothetical protein